YNRYNRAPEWLMHTVVWRNTSDLDTMSLDDLYNHLKVYESEVQKKPKPNSQNMAFISSAKHSSGKEDGNTACTRKKISIQGSNMSRFDKSKVKCFNYHKMGHFARECRVPRSQDKGRRDSYRQGSKANKQAPKALMAIDGVRWDWSYTENDEEDHALVANEVAPIEFALMANSKKEGVDGKLVGLLTASKELDNLIKSQRADKNKEGLGYSAVPPPPAQIYSSSKKDLSWTGLPEFADDTVTDYSRPSPTMKSTSGPDFVMKKKACFNCGDFNHLAYDCRKRVKKSFTSKPVAHRPYSPLVRPVRTNMNGARPNRTSFNKQAHSYANRPFHRTSAMRSHYRAPCVPTINRNFPPVNRKFSTGSRNFPTSNRKFPTASRKFPAGSTKCSTADMGMKGKAGSSQNNIDDKGYWDSGCSRHMTCNISYLSDYEPFDGGYVSFHQERCKITGKGTIKTGKLEFENVYFMKDLKYNLFSVSQNM
nr:ribonuclease H-like domain-containing protein [Tanacetum cinerariifolium]